MNRQPSASQEASPETNLNGTLDLGFPASRTGRKYISVVYTTQSVVFCHGGASRLTNHPMTPSGNCLLPVSSSSQPRFPTRPTCDTCHTPLKQLQIKCHPVCCPLHSLKLSPALASTGPFLPGCPLPTSITLYS